MSEQRAGDVREAPDDVADRPVSPAIGSVTADPRRWLVLGMLAVVQFMLVIDATAVNIALPSIGGEFGLSAVGLAWVVNGYLLTAGGLLLLGGRLADLIGRRTIFLLGTVIFTAASLVCGLAQTGSMLVGGRFAQGVGEALAAPAALSLVALLFTEPRERAKAFGIWGGIAGLGAVVGLLLSGVITDFASWRWVFLINLPIAVVPLLLVPRLVGGGRSPGLDRRLDLVGATLVTGGVLAIVYGLLQAGQYGWPRLGTLAPLIGGLGALGVFLWWESRTPAPLVPLRFFANRTRVAANVCTILVAGSMMAMFFLVVLYMQDILGFGPLQSGLAYLPFMATFTVGLVASTNLVPRLGARHTIVIGLVAAAGGMYLLTRIEADGSYLTQLMPATLVLGLGLGLVNPAMANAALHRVSVLDAGLASGVQTTVMQVGSATGVSILVALAAQRTAGLTPAGAVSEATVAGYHFAFMIAGSVLLLGAVAMLLAMERVTDVSTPPGTHPAAGAAG